ncbi:MAG TPA: hypothetical protein VG733_13845 [Chthoniobacteraceae bacterium]|nr:hypothetical protein [Chthoniobacteraceae bacterium]
MTYLPILASPDFRGFDEELNLLLLWRGTLLPIYFIGSLGGDITAERLRLAGMQAATLVLAQIAQWMLVRKKPAALRVLTTMAAYLIANFCFTFWEIHRSVP